MKLTLIVEIPAFSKNGQKLKVRLTYIIKQSMNIGPAKRERFPILRNFNNIQ